MRILVVTSMRNRARLLAAVLTLTAMLASSPIAAGLSTLSVPKFTVNFVDKSYDVPASTFIDPYTGENVTKPCYHVEDKAIEIVFVNQAFNSHLYYDVRTKGHFEQEWTTRFGLYNSPKMTTDAKTVLTFSPAGEDDWAICYPLVPGSNIIHAPAGGQVDFQVEAFVADYEYVEPEPGVFPVGGLYHFTLESESGWSETQTLTIPAPAPLPENSSSPTPNSISPSSIKDPVTESAIDETGQILQLEATIGIIIVIVLVSAVLLVYLKKRKH